MKTFLAAGIGIVLALTSCGSRTASGPETGRQVASRIQVPSTFLAVRGFEQRQTLALLASRTGRAVRVLARTGADFTNNGLDRSPDGRWIYTTWIGAHSLRIERMSSAGGPRRFIAFGSQPAVSPDGCYLAYVSDEGGQSVAVMNLRTGRTRLWNLRPLIGTGGSLFNGEVFWLGSGELAVHPGAIGVRTATDSPTATRQDLHRDRIIHFDPARPDPRITRITRGPGYTQFMSGGTAAPHSAVASRLLGEKTELDLVDLRTGHRTHLVTVPGMVLAFDRSGTHLLHLIGHSLPALWSAELRAGRLVHRHRILADGRIGGGVDW